MAHQRALHSTFTELKARVEQYIFLRIWDGLVECCLMSYLKIFFVLTEVDLQMLGFLPTYNEQFVRGISCKMDVEIFIQNVKGSSMKSTPNSLPHINITVFYTSYNCSSQSLEECQQLAEENLVNVSSTGEAWPLGETKKFYGEVTTTISADICHDVVYMCIAVKSSEVNMYIELDKSDNILCQVIPDTQLVCQTGVKH